MENIENRNESYFRDLAKKQVYAGAHYVDINCSAMADKEIDSVKWLVDVIQKDSATPLCIDSPDPAVMEIGLSLLSNGLTMINSITAEGARFKAILPLIQRYKAKIIALCIDDKGMPVTALDRLRVAEFLIENLTQGSISINDIYLDPLVKALSTDDKAGTEVLESINLIKNEFPHVHLISAISNISFGLPNRKVLNHVFLIQALTMGMDSFIIDPLDKQLMGCLIAARALLGQDRYCKDYIGAHRKGLYNFLSNKEC
jgi:5-methyltetrahydrofolate--homocysteine methyltransferase